MMKSPSTEIVRALRQQLRGIETAEHVASTVPISSGCAALDRLLPGGGFVPGQLIEWLTEERGSGAGTLAMIVARQACCHSHGALVVADRTKHFYPTAAVAWGIDWQQLIVIRARSEKDELWALDQSLRCPGVAAVWGTFGAIGTAGLSPLAVGGRKWPRAGAVVASGPCTWSA